MVSFSRFALSSLFCASVVMGAEKAQETFAGLTIGQSHREVSSQVSKRENLVGPGKGLFDASEALEATTFRYSGSFNRDNYVENVMLYFSAKGTLAGFDIFMKSRTTFDRYARDAARLYEKAGDNMLSGKVSAGPFKDAEISVELVESASKKAKYSSYVIQVRCPEVLRRENAVRKPAGKEAAESAGSKETASPEEDAAMKGLRRAL